MLLRQLRHAPIDRPLAAGRVPHRFTRGIAILAAATLAALSLAAPARAQVDDDGKGNVPGEFLVKLAPGLDRDHMGALARWLGAEVKREHRPVFFSRVDDSIYLVKLPRWMDHDRGQDLLASLAEVATVVPNQKLKLLRTPNDAFWTDSGLYGLRKIQADLAWDTTTGSTGVVVGIIDTGIDYNHPDLAANMWRHPTTNFHGRDFYNNDDNPIDDNDHGTHCAGTIGGVGNNSVGVAGVNWTVRLAALKIFNAGGSVPYTDGHANLSGAIGAVRYAIDNGMEVTSNSWAIESFNPMFAAEVAAARTAGMVVAVAASNDGANNDTFVVYPANLGTANSLLDDCVVSVAATDSNDGLASFSNRGAKSVHLGAPGVGILSTVRNNGYAYFDGTSMATPHVAGAAALVHARFPGLSGRQVLDRLYANVDPVTSLSTTTITGGRLNVFKAISDPTDTTAPGTVSLEVTGSTLDAVTLLWTAPGEDGSLGGAASFYDIRYSTTPIGGAADFDVAARVIGEPAPAAPGTPQQVTIGSLAPGRTYYFALQSCDNAANRSAIAPTDAVKTSGGVAFFDDFDGAALDATKWTASTGTSSSPWGHASECRKAGARSLSTNPGAFYTNNRSATLMSAPISLAGYTSADARFWIQNDLEPGYDYYYLEVSTNGGSTWTQLVRFQSYGNLRFHTQSLNAYVGQTIQLRFRFTADVSITEAGAYIDLFSVGGQIANQPPTATPQSVTTPEDTNKAITLAGTDPESNPLTYTVLTQPTKGILTGTAPNLTYDPNQDANGTDSFTFRVNDGTSNSAPATVSITITPVNDAPAANDQSVSVEQGSQVAITLTGSDVDLDVLTFSLVTLPSGSLTGTPPNLTYTPVAVGTDSFTFRANDETVDSNVATVTITVTAVNAAPVAGAQTVSTDEDTGLLITLTATDAESSPLTFSIATGPTNGTLTGTPPNVTYTPDDDFNGSDSFTFTASDGSKESEPATIDIAVDAVNDAPVASGQSVNVAHNTATAVTLGATDIDSTPLTFTVVTGPANGSLSSISSSSVTYTPNAGYSGPDSFTFQANDGALDSNVATVTLTVATGLTLQTIAFDGFETTGVFGWTGSRTLQGGNNGAITTSDDPQYEGQRHVRLRSNNGLLRRTVSLAGVTAPTMTVAIRVSSFENGDTAVVRVNGATVQSFANGSDDNQYHLYEVNLAAYAGVATVSIEVDASMSASNDLIYVDALTVTGLR